MTDIIPAWIDGELRPVEKLEVHRRGLRHPAISVFVLDGTRTLIQRRAMSKYHTPGLWANACCTHPHWSESMPDCAMRRLREELGIEGLVLVPRDTVEYRAVVGPDLVEHEVVSLFTAEAPANLTFAPDPEEVAETRWIELAALQAEIARQPEAFTPWLRIYIAEYSGAIFGQAA